VEDSEDDIIVVKNIHKTFLLGVEGIPALRGVSMRIKRGEFITILGKSGGGKTSLLNILGTIDKPTKGELVICGKHINSKTSDPEFAHLRLRKLGFVFQTFNLISSMTAQENVALPMILDGRRTNEQINTRAKALLGRVGMGTRVGHLPSQLSGGEQQRVTIARAVANHPEILLLDEPTGDLDTNNSHIIMQLLIELNRQEHITMVMVTHDQNLKHYAHRVVHMMDGKIFKIESVSEDTRQQMDQQLLQTMQNEAEQKESRKVQKSFTEHRDPRKMYAFHRTALPEAIQHVSSNTGPLGHSSSSNTSSSTPSSSN